MKRRVKKYHYSIGIRQGERHMKQLTSGMLMSSILLISAVTDMGVVSAAERKGFATNATISVKSKKKISALSKRRTASKSVGKSRMRKQAKLTRKSSASLSNSVVSVVQKRSASLSGKERVPVDKLPEVSLTRLRDPSLLPDGHDYRPPMDDMHTSPLPDNLDPKKISPGGGDPRNRPDGMSVEDYIERNRSSDYRARDLATREGQLTQLKFGDDNGDVPGQHWGKPEPEGDTGNESSGGAESDDNGIKLGEAEDHWEDEDEVDADVATYEREKDPEPEGDDPDEMFGAVAQDGQTSIPGEEPTGPAVPSFNRGSKRQPGEWLPGETIVEHGRRVTSGKPLPEDGGPDESIGAVATGGLNTNRLHLGETAKPAPDAGEGGGPINPGPNAIQGQTNMTNVNAALSPTPEDREGGGGTPPRPEF
jgi:hypothetical protein